RADRERVSPDNHGGKHELQQPAPSQTLHDQKHECANEADVQAADYKNVERAAFAEAFGRSRREVVAIAEQGRVEDACGFGFEVCIDLLLQTRPPIVEPCEWWEYTRVAEACDPGGTLD